MRFTMMQKICGILLFAFLVTLQVSCTPSQRRTGVQERKKTSARSDGSADRTEGSLKEPSSASGRRGSRTTTAPSTPSRSGKQLSAEELYAKCSPAVFTIRTPYGQGSGFFIKKDGLAVTNHHVLKGTSTATIIMEDKKQYEMSEILYLSKENDYAIFRVNVKKDVPFLYIFKGKPKVGEKVYAIGSPQGLQNTLSDGLISQFRGDHEIQINVSIDNGSSGGALLNAYGEAVGITSSGLDRPGANLNFAISTEVIRERLNWR